MLGCLPRRIIKQKQEKTHPPSITPQIAKRISVINDIHTIEEPIDLLIKQVKAADKDQKIIIAFEAPPDMSYEDLKETNQKLLETDSTPKAYLKEKYYRRFKRREKLAELIDIIETSNGRITMQPIDKQRDIAHAQAEKDATRCMPMPDLLKYLFKAQKISDLSSLYRSYEMLRETKELAEQNPDTVILSFMGQKHGEDLKKVTPSELQFYGNGEIAGKTSEGEKSTFDIQYVESGKMTTTHKEVI